jgi:hypothetical protein
MNNECSICQEKVGKRNSYKTRKLQCGHFFHSNCLLTWLSTDGATNTCPICREKLDDIDVVVFKDRVEENLRRKYLDAMKTYDMEIDMLRQTIALLYAER